MQQEFRDHPCYTGRNLFDFHDQKKNFQEIRDRLVVGNKITQGRHSSVYRCNYEAIPGERNGYTVKIPKTLLEKQQIVITRLGKLQIAVNSQGTIQHNGIWKKEFDRFNKEFIMGEYVMDPPTLRRLESYRQRKHAGAQIIDNLDDETMQQIDYERKLMENHPGFHHLLHLVHFIPEVPCIIAESCDGNSFRLFMDGTLSSNKELTSTYISHVAMAMLFLYDICGLAHVDLKFSNVLYRLNTPRNYQFILSDYGSCYYAEDPWEHNPVGTEGYTPTTQKYLPSNSHYYPWSIETSLIINVSIYELLSIILHLCLKSFFDKEGMQYNEVLKLTSARVLQLASKIASDGLQYYPAECNQINHLVQIMHKEPSFFTYAGLPKIISSFPKDIKEKIQQVGADINHYEEHEDDLIRLDYHKKFEPSFLSHQDNMQAQNGQANTKNTQNAQANKQAQNGSVGLRQNAVCVCS